MKEDVNEKFSNKTGKKIHEPKITKEGSEKPGSFRMRALRQQQRTSSIVVQPINSLCYTRPQVFDDLACIQCSCPLSRKPLLTASKKRRDENTALLFESFDRINACRANRSEAEAKWPQQ